MITIESTKSDQYVEYFGETAGVLKQVYKDFPLIVEFIEAFKEEQRCSVEWLREHGNEHGYPPEHVVYSVMDGEEFSAVCKNFADLFAEHAAADGMIGKSASLEELQKEILSGETYRQCQRWKKTLQSIDVECQSLVYQFRRNVRHSKGYPTRPKTMEVLKKIRKSLAAHWD